MNTKILIILIIGVILVGGGGFTIWYSQILRCPESCDDGNPCTQDICSSETEKCSHLKLAGAQPGCSARVTCGSYTCKVGVCQIEYISNCCGNKICEVGETYATCPADCPNCDDDNKCTKDHYDYHEIGRAHV